ncbi:hypothetical protein [Parashewanella tropica]|uniref:hypothetical protein n=1 Tax=Parashewanella tropica TaxID=2547970 RepID=UPI00105A6E96|nr:hypothetical protein [Parashewanella tropica]
MATPPPSIHSSPQIQENKEPITFKRTMTNREGKAYATKETPSKVPKYYHDQSASSSSLSTERPYRHRSKARTHSRSHPHSQGSGLISLSAIKRLPDKEQIQAIQTKYHNELQGINNLATYNYCVSSIQKAINSEVPIMFASKASKEDIMDDHTYTAWIPNAPIPWHKLPSGINFPDVVYNCYPNRERHIEIIRSATACVNKTQSPRLVLIILIELQMLGIQVDAPLCTAALKTYSDAVVDDTFWTIKGWNLFNHTEWKDIGACNMMFDLLKCASEQRVSVSEQWVELLTVIYENFDCDSFLRVFPSATQCASEIFRDEPKILPYLINFWETRLTDDYKVSYAATSLITLFAKYVERVHFHFRGRDREIVLRTIEDHFSPKSDKKISRRLNDPDLQLDKGSQAAQIIIRSDMLIDRLMSALPDELSVKTSFTCYVTALTRLYPSTITKIPEEFYSEDSGQLDNYLLCSSTVALGSAASSNSKYLKPLFNSVDKLLLSKNGICIGSALKALSCLDLNKSEYFEPFWQSLKELKTPFISAFYVGFRELVRMNYLHLAQDLLTQAMQVGAIQFSPALLMTNDDQTILYLDFKESSVLNKSEAPNGEISTKWDQAFTLPPELVFVIIKHWIDKIEDRRSEFQNVTQIEFALNIKDISTNTQTYLMEHLPELRKVAKCYMRGECLLINLWPARY